MANKLGYPTVPSARSINKLLRKHPFNHSSATIKDIENVIDCYSQAAKTEKLLLHIFKPGPAKHGGYGQVQPEIHIQLAPRLRSQTESRYVQTVPDGKCLCPDRPRRKVPMSRLSCVHQTFVRSCPDFRAFTRLLCVHVQTFVRSPDFRAFMSRLSCVHVQIFVRSTDFRAFTRLSCVHQTFVRLCPDFRAFTRLSCVHVQTFVAAARNYLLKSLMAHIQGQKWNFAITHFQFTVFYMTNFILTMTQLKIIGAVLKNCLKIIVKKGFKICDTTQTDTLRRG